MQSHDADSIDIFFSLLRSGLYGTPLPESELPESIDWGAINRLARKHVVVGIIIESVRFLPERLRPSNATCAKMDKFALGLIQANMVMDQAAARLVEFLRRHDIEGALLKGQGVARYYRQPQMRHNGDIDFYVGTELYKKAVDVCKKELENIGVACNENDLHFSFKMDGLPIEIHRIASSIYSPLHDRRFQKWVTEELEQSRARRIMKVGETDIVLPSFDFDAIFIFYHAWRHYFTEGIGLRQLCDWAMIFSTHASDIDTERLKKNIARFGMTKGWKLFACIAVDRLGLPADKMPLYDPAYHKKSEKVLNKIVSGGNFGYYSEAIDRTPIKGHGFWHGLKKACNITGYYLSNLPLIPTEATFYYLHRLYKGLSNGYKRAIRKS